MHNKLGKQKCITKYQNDKCQAAFNAMRFMYSISFFHLMSKTPAAVNFINIYDEKIKRLSYYLYLPIHLLSCHEEKIYEL